MSVPVRSADLDHFIIKIDYANSTTNYYGFAVPGTLTSSASWAIKRETLDASSRTTAIDWANGSSNRDQVWDNRATLTYS